MLMQSFSELKNAGQTKDKLKLGLAERMCITTAPHS
jgi:hypothetical protein